MKLTKKYMEEFDDPDFFEDNSYKTNSKDVKTQNFTTDNLSTSNLTTIKVKNPFNGCDRDKYIKKIRISYFIDKTLTYNDYKMFLMKLGYNTSELPKDKISNVRENKIYNAFYYKFESRGYNLDDMERLDDYNYKVKNTPNTENTEKISTIEIATLRNEIYNAYINRSLSYDDLVKFSKIISDEPVYIDRYNHPSNNIVYNKIFDKLKSKGYDMNELQRMSENQDLSIISKVVSEMQREMKKTLVSKEDMEKIFDSICDGTFKNKKTVVKNVYHGTEEELDELIDEII